jgi:hypothetical protein
MTTIQEIQRKQTNNSITLHYCGDKLENHQMNADKFIESITAFNKLIKSVAKDMGIKEEELNIEVQPIKEGSLFTTFLLKVSNHFQQDIINPEFVADNLAGLAIGASVGCGWMLTKKIMTLMNSKKENKNNIKSILENTKEPIDTKIAKNKDNHKYIDDLTKCLLDEVERLEFITKENTHIAYNTERTYYTDPFMLEDNDRIEKARKILRLVGLSVANDGWNFINQETNKNYKAVVETERLKAIAIKEPIEDFSQKDLYCITREETKKKEGNQNYRTYNYIIDFSFEDDENLFSEDVIYSTKKAS